MMKYEKPIIQINSEMAEGVYAASGESVGVKGCDSEYMKGVYQAPKYGWNTTVKEYYGCLGCPANSSNTGCALDPSNHYEQSGTAGSYDTDIGTRMPDWEEMGLLPDRVIDNDNPLPY